MPAARKIARADKAALHHSPEIASPVLEASFQPDPYVDYGRFLTPDGGILIVWKDHDLRWRHTLWRLFAWSMSTGLEAWLCLHHSSIQSRWINAVCLLAAALLNWLIVRNPVELYRTIEIRSDCMIIDGDVFWLRFMNGGWPEFRPDSGGNQLLCGIYGTRFVEYLTSRRFDEFDKAPEVFAAHLQEAMQQLWGVIQD